MTPSQEYRAFYKEHAPDLLKERDRKYTKAYRQKNPGKTAEWCRAYRARKKGKA